jgi:hypothetical protein
MYHVYYPSLTSIYVYAISCTCAQHGSFACQQAASYRYRLDRTLGKKVEVSSPFPISLLICQTDGCQVKSRRVCLIDSAQRVYSNVEHGKSTDGLGNIDLPVGACV